jgi:hypothetical protein
MIPKREPGSLALPVSCLAEFVTGGSRSPISILRPYKFRKDAEGRARTTFYPPVLTAIRKFYKSGKRKSIFDDAIHEWEKRAEATENKALKTKLHGDAKALQSFHKLYAARDFMILPIPRITCRIGSVTWKAAPDLWVRENGIEVLIKLGFSSKTRSHTDVLLAVIRAAALLNNHRAKRENVVYLDARTGEERICRFPISRLRHTLLTASREIAEIWDSVTPAVASRAVKKMSAAAGSP